MAGGVGSRFWPLSKKELPKQFLDISGVGETFIQQTFKRLSSICPVKNIFVVTNHDYLEIFFPYNFTKSLTVLHLDNLSGDILIFLKCLSFKAIISNVLSESNPIFSKLSLSDIFFSKILFKSKIY